MYAASAYDSRSASSRHNTSSQSEMSLRHAQDADQPGAALAELALGDRRDQIWEKEGMLEEGEWVGGFVVGIKDATSQF